MWYFYSLGCFEFLVLLFKYEVFLVLINVSFRSVFFIYNLLVELVIWFYFIVRESFFMCLGGKENRVGVVVEIVFMLFISNVWFIFCLGFFSF